MHVDWAEQRRAQAGCLRERTRPASEFGAWAFVGVGVGMYAMAARGLALLSAPFALR